MRMIGVDVDGDVDADVDVVATVAAMMILILTQPDARFHSGLRRSCLPQQGGSLGDPHTEPLPRWASCSRDGCQ